MRRLAIAITLVFAATAAFAHGNYDGLSSAERCSSRDIRFDDDETFVKKEVINAGNLASFKATVENAPIDVSGDSPSGYTITVCKAAKSLADLDRIRVSVDDGELRTSGPGDRQHWMVMVHVSAPRGANVELETENGPISVRDLDGKVSAHAQNGPLALANLSGTVDAATTNGPISIDGGSGTMRVKAQNGPLSVDLDGSSWRGSLDASTSNGPLTVRVLRDYASGVVVEARGHGPISCRAEGCERARASYDDEPRTFEFGRGPANVHLSTVNGPLTIKE